MTRRLAVVVVAATVLSACGSPTTSNFARGGEGASVSQFEADHHEVASTNCGSENCFGHPVVNGDGDVYEFQDVSEALKDDQGGGGDEQFYPVGVTNREFPAPSPSASVIEYTQEFAPGTSLALAERQVLRWLPSGSHLGAITIVAGPEGCGVATLSGPAFKRGIFTVLDPGGLLMVEFGSVTATAIHRYSPHDVEYATVSPSPAPPVPTC